MTAKINPLNIIIVLFLLVILLGSVANRGEPEETAFAADGMVEEAVEDAAVSEPETAVSPEPAFPVDSIPIIAPYTDYFITQGHHGASYGHLAVDISGGKLADILSSISGQVTQRYVDEWGNPTLVIANDRYEVMLLHGYYDVGVGDVVSQGQVIGSEGNLGYTTDMNGVPCGNGRDCGYHTHLNIYDKIQQTNIDPFQFIEYRE